MGYGRIIGPLPAVLSIVVLWAALGLCNAAPAAIAEKVREPSISTQPANTGAHDGSESQEVNWRAGGGRRIRAIRFSKGKSLPTKSKQQNGSDGSLTAKTSALSLASAATSTVADKVYIDSPPVAGFVPHIAVAVTDERSDDLDWVAQTRFSVAGRYLTNRPEYDFTIGLFDTGAGAHVMGYAAAQRAGIHAADLLTGNVVELQGATNSVFAEVSQPLGLYIDGLAAIEPNAMTLDDSNMVGQSNVSIIVGEEPPADRPDLPTAIGSPMSVNFVTAIYNDRQLTVTYDGNEYTGPDLQFYDHFDADIPEYANEIPLTLIPAGAINIQYIPDYEDILDLVFQPGQPSVIVGVSAQSLFFVDSVDLRHGQQSAIDKRRFMLDTGAQVTVIGSGVASRLGLNPAEADFEVEIQDVTGETTMEPGFFIDSIEIPVLGDWLHFSNVPVVMLDVASPEGGYLEGIIGMNLFMEFNLVLRGGGLFGQAPPSLSFERISLPPVGDIAPAGGDGTVDVLDLAALAAAWLTTADAPNYDPRADIGPRQIPDGVVNNIDFAIFGAHWGEATP